MTTKQSFTLTAALAATSAFSSAVEKREPAPMPPAGQATPLLKQVPMLSPADELKTIQLPAGYRLELVLSEPDIKEPMAIAFDGNGRMYVVEMRTYMQDIDGTGEHDPKSRVSRHESTKGDGKFDKHTVFADNLLIPRMVLPLQDSVLIGETDTNDINEFRDTKHDGVSDQKKPFFEGGPRGGNMEHQPSGLVWAMDNWIYTTYNAYRLRWNPKGATLKENTAPNGGQWGLCQDDFGKPWFSNAGGEKGVWNFQTHIAYGAINVPSQWDDAAWMTVWPAVGLFDVQGGVKRHRDDGTVNHFTGSCGQEIFRGDRLPADLRGNVFLPEPVGRMIRRGVVKMNDGITTLKNPYPESEFIRSTDPNFRPVNMATGPDGCLYIVDAYRGIIQEGNWVKAGSYLRPQVERWGLQNNTNRGRVWRLVHKDFTPGPQPRMLDEKSEQLVAHLDHPNGWWRDTAQKLLVVRQDMSAVPALQTMARTSKNPLARMHAMWTLEGLGALDAALAREKLKDENPRVRENAIRATETLIKAGDKSLQADIIALAKDKDPNVAIQVIGTAKAQNFPEWEKLAQILITSTKSQGVMEIGKALITSSKGPDTRFYSPQEIAVLKKGEGIYKELCFACHGFDGKGMPMQGARGVTMAPPLVNSKTVTLHRNGPVLVLLHGLAGPVNGKTYEAQMVPMNTNPDDWIAAVTSYVRNSFGNSGAFVTPDDVKRLRAATKDRTQPWTQKELADALPKPVGDLKKWKLTASANDKACGNAIDGDDKSRWDTHAFQTPGQWFQIELPEETEISGLRLDTTKSANDYPRGYKVELSADGQTWGKPVAEGKGNGVITEIPFATAKAKFIRITQTGAAKGNYWSIHELAVLKAGKF